jgi:hypothetical protein
MATVAAPGIVVIKSFTYRGAAEEWSNKYHFQGAAPANPADWRALCDAFILQEKAVLTDVVNIIRVQCYEDTDNPSVYTYDLAAFGGVVAGTYVTGSSADLLEAGDTVGLIRWNTGRVSSRGKPVYLFKYYHGVMHESGQPDRLRTTLKTAYATFANAIRSAASPWPGLADKTGTEPVGYLAETYLTTRTLKRRGRRPT